MTVTPQLEVKPKQQTIERVAERGDDDDDDDDDDEEEEEEEEEEDDDDLY